MMYLPGEAAGTCHGFALYFDNHRIDVAGAHGDSKWAEKFMGIYEAGA